MSANHPKFTVGDYVRITGVSTVYRIDGYSLTNETHTYHLEGTPETSQYAEDVLEAIVGFEDLDDIEAELIVPLFDVGDTVQIEDCSEVYRVLGGWPEMIYALENIETNEVIDMDESLLRSTDIEVSENFTEVASVSKEERNLSPREQSSKAASDKKRLMKERKQEIDKLLDEYNDLKTLSKIFNDSKYDTQAQKVLDKISVLQKGN